MCHPHLKLSLSTQQFCLPTLAFQLPKKQYRIVLQLVFVDLDASVGTLQPVFAAPVALAVILAVFVILEVIWIK